MILCVGLHEVTWYYWGWGVAAGDGWVCEMKKMGAWCGLEPACKNLRLK